MSSIASVLKSEITRLARKEVKAQTATMQRQSAKHRRDIAELKRQVAELTRRLSFLERQETKRVAQKPSKKLAEGARFSARSVKAQRKRLGLSAEAFGHLVGVSTLTIYNWESGNTKPRKQQLAALVGIRSIGKREAKRRLHLLS